MTTNGSRTATRPATCADWSRHTRIRTRLHRLRRRARPGLRRHRRLRFSPTSSSRSAPDARIAAFYADGRKLTNLPPGTYYVQVHDLSANHNLHLTGPGIDEKTSVGDIEHPIWHLTFKAGTYRLKCDVHPTITGSFTVSTNAPPVPKCKVPQVIGKGLSKARRSIRAAHCSVGRVRYMRSKRVRGRVVRQSPGAGRTFAVGTRVNLVVSRGPG